MEYVDALPLYREEPQSLGKRFVPLCVHRQLDLDCFRELPREPGTYETPECHNTACTRPKLVQLASDSRKLFSGSVPVAYAVTSSCPLEAVRKYFNKRRIANALPQLRICPHLAMNSKAVSDYFSPRRTLHLDCNGNTPTQTSFTRRCCQKFGASSMHVRECQQCTDQGFYTAYGFVSREREATREVPHNHVEILLVTYTNIGQLDDEDDVDWIAHTHAEHELQEWGEIWTAWQHSVSRAIFWRPLEPYKACPRRVAQDKKRAEANAAKCDEVARWREQMYGSERLDLQTRAERVVERRHQERRSRRSGRQYVIGWITGRLR